MKNHIRKFVTLSALCLAGLPLFSQNEDPAVKYAGLITEEGLRDKLTILASDALEGRMTGTRGQKFQGNWIERSVKWLIYAGGSFNTNLSRFNIHSR
jgi:hypothetical protein